MNCDVASVTGKSHRICEDYARCNSEWRHYTTEGEPGMLPLLPKKPYIILADGCSSSDDTDIGARLLVKAAEGLLGSKDLHRRAIFSAASVAKCLEMDEMTLDATLLVAQAVNDTVEVSMFGDGVIAAKHWDGTIEVISINYDSGCPYYPSYLLDEEREKRLLEMTKGNPRTVQRFLIRDDSSILESPAVQETGPLISTAVYDTSKVSHVALFTDGVQSFSVNDEHYGPKAISLDQVISKMMNFKGATVGEFVRRAMNGFVKNAERNEWTHSDDVSMGVIYTGE